MSTLASLFMVVGGALISPNPGVVAEQGHPDQAIALSAREALEQFSLVYGKGAHVRFDLAPIDTLSRALITTADGDNVEFAWTRNAGDFLAEFERAGQPGSLTTDLPSKHNNGIRLRIFEYDDAQWRVEHSWMDHDGIMRLVAVKAEKLDLAIHLVERAALAREQGLFGSHPWVGGPLPEPPPHLGKTE